MEGVCCIIFGRRYEPSAVKSERMPYGIDMRGDCNFLIPSEFRDDVLAPVCANIAGIGSPGPAFTADMKLEDFKYCLENNVVSIFLSMKYEIQQMLKQGGGSICNAASVGAIVGVPNAGDYIGTKHAILGMTRSAAVEYAASGIRVNAIGPHVSKTRMLDAAFAVPGLEEVITGSIPMKRVSDPDEPARATLFLLSDEASYITGQLIVADGGWTAG